MGSTPIAGTILSIFSLRGGLKMNALGQFLPLILLIVLMYFLLIRPQKKREKETAEMRNSIRVGDEVVTIGGICGKIVKTKDETLIIEVGADKIKFEIMRWAINKVEVKGESGKKAAAVAEAEAEADAANKKIKPKRMKKADEAAEETVETVETVEEKPEEVIEHVDAEIVDEPITKE